MPRRPSETRSATSAKPKLHAGSARPAAKKCVSLSRPPLFDLGSDDAKGKARARGEDDRLWVDRYEPTTEAELAVHKRKVEDVRRWLREATEGGRCARYRRVLALTGRAGTAKTTTVRVLSRELGMEILEWRNCTSGDDDEALFDKFQAFLTRAMSCSGIFARRRLVLLEDLPNLLHPPTQARFQSAIRSLCAPGDLSHVRPPPVVVIVSDSGLRAEQPDDGQRWSRPEVLDIRNVLGPELLASPLVTRIGFNPVAPTLMRRALQALLAKVVSAGRADKDPALLDSIVDSSDGDIRRASMALEFACTRGRGTRAGAKRAKSASVQPATRRERSLALFHLVGKILYNKRKGDPCAGHLSAREAAKERELDAQLIHPWPLPDWLSEHERKASRVCVEGLIADSTVDSSLLGAYIHQNYTRFCTQVEECQGICDGLSWTDSIGGNHPTTPYAFPTLALATLHSLPTPVPRTAHKMSKPAWFDARLRELEAWDAVEDVARWLAHGGGGGGGGAGASVGRWTHANIATELGGWLRAVDRRAVPPPPPRSHTRFSCLAWTAGAVPSAELGEDEDGEAGAVSEEERNASTREGGEREEGVSESWWVGVDDIEEVD